MWKLYRAVLIYLLKGKDNGIGFIEVFPDKLDEELKEVIKITGRTMLAYSLLVLLERSGLVEIFPEINAYMLVALTNKGVEMAELLENEERWNECLEYLKEKNIPLVKESIEDCYSLLLKTMR